MKYYRVKPEAQDVPMENTLLVQKELYTINERNRLFGNIPENSILFYMDRVEVSKHHVYTVFGARFSTRDAKISYY